MSGVVVDPTTVKIRGAQTRLDQINFAHTETIFLTGRSSDFDTEVAIDVHDPSVEIAQGIVKVHVIVSPATNQATLDNLPIRIMPADKRLIVDPATVKVTFEGDQDTINSIKAQDISIFVDTTQIDQNRMATVQLVLSQRLVTGVRVRKIEPERVLIKNR